MNIKEVASSFGVKANQLRFYEKKGLIFPERDKNDYRVYSMDDLLRLQEILTYRAFELSIEDIKILLSDEVDLETQLFKQLSIVNDTIHKYRTIQSSLETVMDAYLDNKTNKKLQLEMIEAGKKIGQQMNVKNDWRDLWNFDDWADNYDARIKNDIGNLSFFDNYDQVLDEVYEISTHNFESGSVLDIGNGTGNLTCKYLLSSYEVIGLDQSLKMLFTCKKKWPNMKLRYGEFLKLPFENKVFDRIVTTYAFHHLNEDEKVIALQEMKRVLNDKGEIVIGDIMFSDEVSKKKFYEACDELTKKVIDDEYYSIISLLKPYIKELNMKIDVKQIDELMFILRLY